MISIKILASIILALIVAVLSGVIYLKYRLANTPDKGNLEAALDLEINKKHMDKGLSYGLVIGIYKDEKVFIKGYGTVNQNSTTVPDGTTIFQLASVSKLFTASTYQILSDGNFFDADATLSDILSTTIKLSPLVQETTLRQLATHTSGFPSVPKPIELEAIKLAGENDLMLNPYGNLGTDSIFAYLETADGKREPGRFEYSNYGMGLLGHVMEIATKRDLETLVTETVLAPLGMNNTAITLTPEMNDYLAQGYDENGKPSPIWTFSSLAGAGALNSNVEDMMKFVQANIEDNSPLSQSLKKMHEQQFNGYTGIGWMQPTFLDKFIGNQNIVWHNGRVGGYTSYISIDTKNKTGIVILSNKSVDITMLGMMLTRLVRTQSWASP